MIEPIYGRLIERVETHLAAARAAIGTGDAGTMLLNTTAASCILNEVAERMIANPCLTDHEVAHSMARAYVAGVMSKEPDPAAAP